MKRACLILAFLLICGAAESFAQDARIFMQVRPQVASGITLDKSESALQTTADHSYTHAQGSLTNGIAIVIVMWVPNASTSCTATYGGDAMTLIEEKSQDGAYLVSIFKKDLGSAGSGNKTVVVDFNSTMYKSFVVSLTYSGVAQDTAYTDGGSGSNWSTAPALTLATATDSLVVGGLATGNLTVTNNDTVIAQDTSAGQKFSAQYAAGTGGNVTLDWTLSTNNAWAVAGVVLTKAD